MNVFVIVKDMDTRYEIVLPTKAQCVDYLFNLAKDIMKSNDPFKRIDVTADSIRLTSEKLTTEYLVLRVDLDSPQLPQLITTFRINLMQRFDDAGIKYNETW